ncbi:MAG: 8-amino-7-oxononanoate synthase [Pseudomonadales bacterium]|jgi:8-amino-7-oxononanoate synthase
MGAFDDLAEQLQVRKQQHLYRSRLVTETAQGAVIGAGGQHFLNFCSNDYLGLANHPQVVARFKEAADHYGVGGGASHLVNGHSRAHHALEEALAAFTGRQRALLFSTGYMANLGVISALLGRGDAVFEDRLNHASLLDGGLLSGARFQRFRHADVGDLDQRLAASDAHRKLVVADGVFSMDGDIAPLREMAEAAQTHDAWLMVDDAHGIGCLGEGGRGSLSELGLTQQQVPVLMGTLGKGIGTSGAFVAGSEDLIETLIQQARTYIYTTAMPPAVAAATMASLAIAEADEWRREKLAALIQRFRDGASQLGLRLMASKTPIQPVVVGKSSIAVAISENLKKQGVLVTAIRPPTVPEGTARLRVTLSASHSNDQVDRLLEALAASVRSEGVSHD